MPGKSTRTILCKPGPFTVIEITSVLTVLPCLTLFNIRSSTYKQENNLDLGDIIII